MGKFYDDTDYYPSDKLHIGHAHTTVIADALPVITDRLGMTPIS